MVHHFLFFYFIFCFLFLFLLLFFFCGHGLACLLSLYTDSLGFPLRHFVDPLLPPWVTTSGFLVGNREHELKSTTFSSLLFFLVFLSFLFSWPPSDIAPMSAACWGYSLIMMNDDLPEWVKKTTLLLFINNHLFYC